MPNEKENKFRVFLPVEPRGKQRARVLRSGRSYTPKETKETENLIRLFLVRENPPMYETGALSLKVYFHILKPKSVSKKRLYPSVKPDIDNLTKTIFDSLQGICFKNDSQIVDLCAYKRYAARQGILVELSPLAD